MKAGNYFSIKLSVERICIAALFIFCILLSIMVVTQNTEIQRLKSDLTAQHGLTEYLDNRVGYLENQNFDFEDMIYDVEGRIDDLESGRNY